VSETINKNTTFRFSDENFLGMQANDSKKTLAGKGAFSGALRANKESRIRSNASLGSLNETPEFFRLLVR
jgi:hypothetical protein